MPADLHFMEKFQKEMQGKMSGQYFSDSDEDDETLDLFDDNNDD